MKTSESTLVCRRPEGIMVRVHGEEERMNHQDTKTPSKAEVKQVVRRQGMEGSARQLRRAEPDQSLLHQLSERVGTGLPAGL